MNFEKLENQPFVAEPKYQCNCGQAYNPALSQTTYAKNLSSPL